MYKSVMQVQNAFWGTKLFMNNGKESIMNNDLEDIDAFIKSLLSRPDNEQSANTASKMSTASKFSTHEEFVYKYPYRNIDELLELQQAYCSFRSFYWLILLLMGEVSIIVAIVILIHEEEGWWYLGCRKCNKKVVSGDELMDLEREDTSAPKKGTNGFFTEPVTFRVRVLSQVIHVHPSIIRFYIQCRVQDETGTASLVLFEKDVKSISDGTSAYQLLATQERNSKLDEFPANFDCILGNKYAFKINMDEWQSKKLLPSWTVKKMSGDPKIINVLIPMITQSKVHQTSIAQNTIGSWTMFLCMLTSDAAVKDKNISPLDLAYVTDDNGTSCELLKFEKHYK
ncbi:nucleic acid-binding, OB-fold protein [Artemisia annua]|uniref:Nucleic acid-binding, OB-fold protein n=1 Tax=Artemisia annua TaxID=35608 RepID=A0A2U1KLQ4_ARTAN|nr:nucleic acid-binding, OB-fold protein [Artemisia annua]